MKLIVTFLYRMIVRFLQTIRHKNSSLKLRPKTQTFNKKKKTMNKYPIRHLPIAVREALSIRMIGDGYVTELPHSIAIRGDKSYAHFSTPRPQCTAFAMDVNLKTKAVVFSMGEYEGKYASRPLDRERVLSMERDHVIIKGYLTSASGTNVLIDVEAIFHPAQALKVIPEVKLDERERKILFCFGSLKDGFVRREALSRLDVSKPEIEALVVKGVLRKINGGHAITVIGEANRLPRPVRGGKVAVDQW